MKSLEIKLNGSVFCVAKFAESWLSKTKGLMYERKAFPILFNVEEFNSFHTLFCPTFDAVFLDGSKRIIGFIRSVPKWKTSLPIPDNAVWMLELPKLDSLALKVGEVLEW